MTTFFANNETDGDGVYHVHYSTCGVRPRSNYFIIQAQNMTSAVNKAQAQTGKDYKACKVCG